MSNLVDDSFSEIDTLYKSLVARHESFLKKRNIIEAELSARKRALKAVIDECKSKGIDPDKLQDELKKSKEILVVKMEIFSADLTAAENIIKPMLREIEKA